MLKNKFWLGITLSIILLIFSMPGFTAYYKYTQESGTNFYVGAADKADALEDTNEMRQIIDDLGALLVHSKRNDLYPKDETTGGTLAIPNSALVSFATGTKGDLFYCSATNVWTKLNVGTNNQILVVATDVPNWETPSSDLLSDVASIAMLDENEAITGAWTVTGSIGGVDTTEFSYLADISAFGASIIDDADEATFKATVNLEIGTDVLAYQAIGIADDNLVEMDDADAAVDDYCKLTANGIIGRNYTEVKTDLSLNLVANLKVKLDATGAPTVNNDVDEGYTVGSRWFDVTNDKEYVCLDNTDGAAVWTETTGAAGGYTNLTEFVDQNNWKIFYSDGSGDVIELALGADGTYLRSNGATSAPTFGTPTGAGDMLKATYDTDEDGDVDVAAGGTEKSSWTLYAIPYLSGTTAFGEITIGTAEYALTVNAGANGYDWTLLQTYDAGLLSLAGLTYSADSFVKATAEDTYTLRTSAQMKTDLGYMTDLEDDTDPDLGGQLQAGAHSINFTEQVLTSGTAISWNLGNSNKAVLTVAHNFTITITAPSGALNAQLIVTQDGTGTRVMDEIVTQKDEAIATTDVHADTDIIDLIIDIPTGARIRFKTSAADLPDPLVVDTIYYAIRSSENHIKVATTKANAVAGTQIDITDTGSGTHTVQQLVKWVGGILGVLSTAAGSEDILALTYKTADKQWYAQLAKDFY